MGKCIGFSGHRRPFARSGIESSSNFFFLGLQAARPLKNGFDHERFCVRSLNNMFGSTGIKNRGSVPAAISRFFATYLTRFPIENDFRQEQRTATRSHWETLRLKKVEKRVVDSIGTRLGVPQCCSLGRATLIGLLLRARLGEPLRGMLGRIPPLRLSACGSPVRLRRTLLECPLARSVKRQCMH